MYVMRDCYYYATQTAYARPMNLRSAASRTRIEFSVVSLRRAFALVIIRGEKRDDSN